MNKAELVSAMAEESGLTKVDSRKALDAFMSVVTDTLQTGERVSLIGFGTFSVSQRKARTGINPATQEPIQIPAKKVARFKAGLDLATAVDK